MRDYSSLWLAASTQREKKYISHKKHWRESKEPDLMNRILLFFPWQITCLGFYCQDILLVPTHVFRHFSFLLSSANLQLYIHQRQNYIPFTADWKTCTCVTGSHLPINNMHAEAIRLSTPGWHSFHMHRSLHRRIYFASGWLNVDKGTLLLSRHKPAAAARLMRLCPAPGKSTKDWG